jgi:hypothetical protein
MFGRSREEAQVVYPTDYAIVGEKHFALNRNPAGDYHIKLFGKRYVAMDGRPVIDGALVKSGSVFRLGKQTGPAFEAEIAAPARTYVKTEEGEEMPDVGGWLGWLRERTERLGARSRQLAAGGGVLGVLLIGAIGWSGFYVPWHKEQVREQLLQSVYLVVQKDSLGDIAAATAFVIGPHQFATNAHVTEQIRGKVQGFYLLGPKGDKIAIVSVESHPGYAAFKAKARTYAKSGSTDVGNFQSAALPSAYDVGIIDVDPSASLPPPLEIVTAEEALKLEVGDDVMTAGFPSENIRGADNLVKGLAAATFRTGNIESLKDIFFSKSSDDPKHLLMVQHGMPVAGGVSGSPVVNSWTGKVVAVISGGNTRPLPGAPKPAGTDPISLQDGKQERMTDAAQVNYGQRADLLGDLMQGTAYTALAHDYAYWEKVCGTCPRYFDLALEDFASGGASAKAGIKEIAVGYGVLTPGVRGVMAAWAGEPAAQAGAGSVPVSEASFKRAVSMKVGDNVYSIEAKPGLVYGFIVDTIDALPWTLDSQFAPRLSLRVTQTAPLVTEVKPVPGEAQLPLTLMVSVTQTTKLDVVVGGLLEAPARYVLHAFSWELPPALSTVSPRVTPASQPGTDAATVLPQP